MISRDEALRQLAAGYEGFESVEAYPDAAALAAHREHLLDRSRSQADFIGLRLGSDPCLLELACGNGRLLIDLRRRRVIACGVGIDVARSRIDFAARWATDECLDGLDFSALDLVEYRPRDGEFDAVVCITGAFAYFEPIEAGLGSSILRAVRQGLVDGGLLILELYPHPGYRRLLDASGGRARLWTELPDDDPWRFYLSDLSLEGNVLTHAKTFIHRTEGRIDDGRRERLVLYTPQTLDALLREAGFGNPSFHEGWTDAPYSGGETLVVVARRDP